MIDVDGVVVQYLHEVGSRIMHTGATIALHKSRTSRMNQNERSDGNRRIIPCAHSIEHLGAAVAPSVGILGAVLAGAIGGGVGGEARPASFLRFHTGGLAPSSPAYARPNSDQRRRGGWAHGRACLPGGAGGSAALDDDVALPLAGWRGAALNGVGRGMAANEICRRGRRVDGGRGDVRRVRGFHGGGGMSGKVLRGEWREAVGEGEGSGMSRAEMSLPPKLAADRGRARVGLPPRESTG